MFLDAFSSHERQFMPSILSISYHLKMSEPSLSPKEVAQQLGLCTKTVLTRIKSGDIHPVYRINKRVIRIPQSSIDAYLARCCGPPSGC